MNSNSNTILHLIRQEVLETKRRSGEIGPHTVVTTYDFPGSRAKGLIAKRLV